MLTFLRFILIYKNADSSHSTVSWKQSNSIMYTKVLHQLLRCHHIYSGSDHKVSLQMPSHLLMDLD